ncbi:YgaP family membrane protein [Alsobacter sp. R-9]
MTRNVGGFDRLIRFYLGLAMVAVALPYWAPQTGWNWIGWLGVLPMLSAVAGSCKLYKVAGISTCAAR